MFFFSDLAIRVFYRNPLSSRNPCLQKSSFPRPLSVNFFFLTAIMIKCWYFEIRGFLIFIHFLLFASSIIISLHHWLSFRIPSAGHPFSNFGITFSKMEEHGKFIEFHDLRRCENCQSNDRMCLVQERDDKCYACAILNETCLFSRRVNLESVSWEVILGRENAAQGESFVFNLMICSPSIRQEIVPLLQIRLPTELINFQVQNRFRLSVPDADRSGLATLKISPNPHNPLGPGRRTMPRTGAKIIHR